MKNIFKKLKKEKKCQINILTDILNVEKVIQ